MMIFQPFGHTYFFECFKNVKIVTLYIMNIDQQVLKYMAEIMNTFVL